LQAGRLFSDLIIIVITLINVFKRIVMFNKNQITISRKITEKELGKVWLFIRQKEKYNNIHDRKK